MTDMTKEDMEAYKKEMTAKMDGLAAVFIDMKNAMLEAQANAAKQLPEIIKMLTMNPELQEQKARADEVHKTVTGISADFVQLNANIQQLYAEIKAIQPKAKK